MRAKYKVYRGMLVGDPKKGAVVAVQTPGKKEEWRHSNCTIIVDGIELPLKAAERKVIKAAKQRPLNVFLGDMKARGLKRS